MEPDAIENSKLAGTLPRRVDAQPMPFGFASRHAVTTHPASRRRARPAERRTDRGEGAKQVVVVGTLPARCSFYDDGLGEARSGNRWDGSFWTSRSIASQSTTYAFRDALWNTKEHHKKCVEAYVSQGFSQFQIIIPSCCRGFCAWTRFVSPIVYNSYGRKRLSDDVGRVNFIGRATKTLQPFFSSPMRFPRLSS